MTLPTAHRPTIAVTRHAISAGHYLAATAGFAILEAGGTVADAAAVIGEGVEPNSDLYASADYRLHLARVHGARALKAALSRAA